MRSLSKIALTFLLFCSPLLVNEVIAQPPPPTGPPCWPPPCIPIDGGVSWLALAGILFGAAVLYFSTKKKTVGDIR